MIFIATKVTKKINWFQLALNLNSLELNFILKSISISNLFGFVLFFIVFSFTKCEALWGENYEK